MIAALLDLDESPGALGIAGDQVPGRLLHAHDVGDRDARLVATERQGKRVVYRLHDAHVGSIVEDAITHAAEAPDDDAAASAEVDGPPAAAPRVTSRARDTRGGDR